MISRRELLAGGAAGAMAGNVGLEAAQDLEERYLSSIAADVGAIRNAAMAFNRPPGLEAIRAARRTYFKNTGRFPEFVDVGFDVYETVIDWLIAMQQPVTLGRMPDGKYTVALHGTVVVLRPDFPDNYVGQGYDK